MPLFICSRCGTIENTACTNYWRDVAGDDKLPLCSECDPSIGQWHGRFPKRKPTQEEIVSIMAGGCAGHPPIDDAGRFINVEEAVVVHAVYDNPKDYPGKFVVRRSYSLATGQSFPDPRADVYDDLSTARQPLEEKGLFRFEADVSDDPVIVESWI